MTNSNMTERVVSFSLRMIMLCVSMLVGFSAYAQGSYTVKLKLVDSKTSEPVGFATTSLTVNGQDKASKYALTDGEGNAELAKVRKGTYILKAELMGYKAHQQEITVDKNLDLGQVKMDEDVEVLDAASVSAVGNPIVVKKDTIEYSASSFKTSENDMLEELLKKLPGVEVGTDGSITANGETINKITIDGKTFFLDDPQLASKNIPAKIVEKVKVVERKSEQAQFTGIDDGEEETIIDLSLRPGMMQGWFGNVMGGGGKDIPGAGSDMNDARYQGAAMVGRFTEDSQISVILNGNNTNNRGFNDMAGSMMQGMRTGGMGRGTGGWGGNNGISTSWMGGVNGAFTLLDDDMDLSGNYLYNGNKKYVEEESLEMTEMQDKSVLIEDRTGTSNANTWGHRVGVRLEHKFSENTSILFEPQFNFGGGDYTEYSDFSTLKEVSEKRDSTSKGKTLNSGNNDNWTASGFFLFRQRLGKPGRTISANIRYSFSENAMSGNNHSITYGIDKISADDEKPVTEWILETAPVNQRFKQKNSSKSLSGRVVYTEPLVKDLYLEANYEYSWNESVSNKETWNSGSDDLENGLPKYNYDGETVDPIYSNNIRNRYINQSAGLNLSYQKEKLRTQLGVSLNPTDTYNETDGEIYDTTVINWSPQAMFMYEFNDNTSIRMFYFGRSSQPSTSQLMPVPDNTDPLNISFGNPYLSPYFNHNIRGMFGYTNKKTFTSVHGRFGAGYVKDGITSAIWYGEDGKKPQYSIPVNGPGSGNIDARIMINSPLGKSNFSIFSMTYARYSQATAYIGKGNLDTEKYYDAENAKFDYDLFHSDFPTLAALEKEFLANRTQTVNFTQRLRLTFRNDFVELNLGGRTRMNKSWYTMNDRELAATWNNQVDASMNWTIPGGFGLVADVDYNWYNGYTTPQEDEVILNAEITKLLFKDKFTLALKAYDILGQSKNISISDTANERLETRNNTLGRYIILSLTYRFGTFNGNSGPRRGPMGPPPGR